MELKKYLAQVAHKVTKDICGSPSEIWESNFDDSYMTHVGMEDNLKFLAAREITEELTHGVGYSPKDGKWYGWSHRAIYGFLIGSTCEKGSCHYVPVDEKDSVEDGIRFWSDESHLNVRAGEPFDGEEGRGVDILWDYTDDVPNKSLRGTIGGVFWRFPGTYGKGEWTAKTMEDAKQMAVDFNEGVS